MTAGLAALATTGFTLAEAAATLGLGLAELDDLLERLCDLRPARPAAPSREVPAGYRIPLLVRQFVPREQAADRRVGRSAEATTVVRPDVTAMSPSSNPTVDPALEPAPNLDASAATAPALEPARP